MEQFKLFNFDHGLCNAKEIRTGNFTIKVTTHHCKNILLLKQAPSTSFSFSIKIGESTERSVKYKEGQSGQFCETAIVEIDKNNISQSLLYDTLTDELTNVDDFALVLSFLSGRRVYLEADLREGLSKNYKTRIVNYDFYYSFNMDLESIQEIKNLELETAFVNLVHACSFEDIGSLFFYANSALNAIYEKWCTDNGESKYKKQNIVGNLQKQTVEKAKIQFIKILQEDNVNTDIIQDIEARIPSILSPSTLFKLKSFLINIDLYPKEGNGNHKKKLKWINMLRNSMFHSGNLPKDKNISKDRLLTTTFDVTSLVIAIVQYYFAKIIFKIDNDSVEKIKKDINQYFNEGKFRGKKVFDETYEEYIERVENAWLENGRLPMF